MDAWTCVDTCVRCQREPLEPNIWGGGGVCQGPPQEVFDGVSGDHMAVQTTELAVGYGDTDSPHCSVLVDPKSSSHKVEMCVR